MSHLFQENPVATELPLFAVGQVVATAGVSALINRGQINSMTYLRRHVRGDWGDLPDEDLKLNNYALKTEGRLFSAYEISSSLRLWIITEWDRSVTTLLLPSEY